MKKVILLFCFSAAVTFSFAQFSINGTSSVTLNDQSGVDYVFIVNGISATTSLQYRGTGSMFTWYTYKDGVKTFLFSENNSGNKDESEIVLEEDDAIGYTFEVDGTEVAKIWVINYRSFMLNPETMRLEVDYSEATDRCENVSLLVSGKDKIDMQYQTPAGAKYSLSRNFTMTYNTLEWGDESWIPKEEKDESITSSVILNDNISVKAPLENTIFTLSGDQYALQLGLPETPSIDSEFYETIALESHLMTLTVVRDALNEVDRPQDLEQLEGSAPLEIEFRSNSSNPNNSYYSWEIYKGEEVIVTRAEENQRHEFTDYGEYTVKLRLSNPAGCSYLDSVKVSISESLLKVPNVFTPNGDGINDEFRVAYRSLKSFHCWVYNSWGNMVFEWTDPGKGWDGRINGKNAAAAAYFYIIRAEGTDGKKYNLKGDINIIR